MQLVVMLEVLRLLLLLWEQLLLHLSMLRLLQTHRLLDLHLVRKLCHCWGKGMYLRVRCRCRLSRGLCRLGPFRRLRSLGLVLVSLPRFPRRRGRSEALSARPAQVSSHKRS